MTRNKNPTDFLRRNAKKMIFMLSLIDQFVKVNGYAPSIRNLCEMMLDGSTSHVAYYLDILVDTCMLERDHRIARSMRVTQKGRNFMLYQEVPNDPKEK